MTARSKKQRNRNARIKREKNKPKELARLKKTLGIVDTDELMETDQVKVVDKERIRARREEQLIKEEWIEQKIQQERGEIIKVVNQKTQKKHCYNTKTMKDQFGSYPVWYKPHKVKRKLNKRRVDHDSNFWTGGFLQI